MNQNNNSLLLKININIFISIRRPQKQLPILTLLTISGFVLDFEKKLRKKRFKLFNIFWTRIEMKTKKKPSYFQNVKSFFWKSFASNTNLVFLKSENSSSSDDVSDITCPFCSSNEEALLQGIGPYYEGRDSREPLYCTKGSICSRRSRATVLSRNVRGRRKKPSRPAAGTTKKAQCSKIRKKVQFQKYKKALFAILKMAKNQFLHQKKFKTTKNPGFFNPKIEFLVVLNFYLTQKLIFCHF